MGEEAGPEEAFEIAEVGPGFSFVAGAVEAAAGEFVFLAFGAEEVVAGEVGAIGSDAEGW